MNDVDLRTYVERLLAEHEARHGLECTHQHELAGMRRENDDLRAEMVKLAREEINKRLEGMNELREQLERERGTFVRSDVWDVAHRLMSGRLGDLEVRAAAVAGRDRAVIIVVGVVAAVVGAVLAKLVGGG